MRGQREREERGQREREERGERERGERGERREGEERGESAQVCPGFGEHHACAHRRRSTQTEAYNWGTDERQISDQEAGTAHDSMQVPTSATGHEEEAQAAATGHEEAQATGHLRGR